MSDTAQHRHALLIHFRTLAGQIVDKKFDHVTEATELTTLGIDSLGMLEIIGSLESELNIHIAEESLSGLVTLRDLLDVVAKEQRTQRT
jgi:acyl carrier protein